MKERQKKMEFSASTGQWSRSIVFLFSLSLTGLGLWPFLLVTAIMMLHSYFKEPREFIVQLFVFSTYSGFIGSDQLPVKLSDLMMIASIGLLLFGKLNQKIRPLLVAFLLYVVGVFLLAMTSMESMMVQIKMMRYYFVIITFIIPLFLLRSDRDGLLGCGHYLVVYSLVICGFYIIDGFILNGFVMLPNTYLEEGVSRWNNLWVDPLTTYFPRKYPPGLFILIPTAYYISRYFRLNLFQWLLIIGAMAASRTMTFLAAFLVVLIFSMSDRHKIRRNVVGLSVGLVIVYLVDLCGGGFLRFSSTVNQFFDLKEAVESGDVEMISEFGSGRLAQALPKMELLLERNRLWTGFGFIHPSESFLTELILKNPFYPDQSVHSSVEMPAEVEITQVQTVLNIGLIGLLLQMLFYSFIAVYLYRSNMKWQFYFAVLIGVSISGLGGFIGLTTAFTMWLGLALGLSMLHENDKDEEIYVERVTM